MSTHLTRGQWPAAKWLAGAPAKESPPRTSSAAGFFRFGLREQSNIYVSVTQGTDSSQATPLARLLITPPSSSQGGRATLGEVMPIQAAQFWQELGKIVTLPEKCRSADIKIRPLQPVVMVCEVFLDGNAGETVTKRYRLQEITDEGAEVASDQGNPA
jgi:hypothetical protein